MAGTMTTASQMNTARVSLVSSEMARLAAVADNLSSLCGNIESRFSSVVRQTPSGVETYARDRGLIDKNSESVPLANSLRDANERLESVLQRLSIMLENTEP